MDKSMAFITLTPENVMSEHLCCAIADKKHQTGVNDKRNWLAERIKEGHVFRKLDAQGKVFIEYAPLEKAWVPVTGDNYFYIYCLWVSGSYKGKGYGKELLQSCIDDAKAQGKSGICLLSSIIRKSKFPQNPKRSVRFLGKGTKRSVQKKESAQHSKSRNKSFVMTSVSAL